ncbi:hypothetical protein Tco_0714675, partial [Tanacetum coccineum]
MLETSRRWREVVSGEEGAGHCGGKA